MYPIGKWGLGLSCGLWLSTAVADLPLSEKQSFGDWQSARQLDGAGNLNACLASTASKAGDGNGATQIVISTVQHSRGTGLDEGTGPVRVMYVLNVSGVNDTSGTFTGQLIFHLSRRGGSAIRVLNYRTLTSSRGAQNLILRVSSPFLGELRNYDRLTIELAPESGVQPITFSLNGFDEALSEFEQCFAALWGRE